MNNVRKIINALLKDDNIPRQLKNLDSSVTRLNQTVDLVSAPCVGLLAKTIKPKKYKSN